MYVNVYIIVYWRYMIVFYSYTQWLPRNIARNSGPKTIQQVHHDAAREMGVQIPTSHAQHDAPFYHSNGDLFGRSNHNRPPMADMFGPSSPPTMIGGNMQTNALIISMSSM